MPLLCNDTLPELKRTSPFFCLSRLYNKPADKCQVTSLPSERTSPRSSCWSTPEPCRWSPSPEPEWKSCSRQSLRCALCPVWDKRAWGSEWSRCPRPGAQLAAAAAAAAVSGWQLKVPTRFHRSLLTAAVFPSRYHFEAWSHQAWSESKRSCLMTLAGHRVKPTGSVP